MNPGEGADILRETVITAAVVFAPFLVAAFWWAVLHGAQKLRRAEREPRPWWED